MEVVASLSQGRTAAAQCGLFTYKSVPVIFEPPCMYNIVVHIFIQYIYIYIYIYIYLDYIRCLLQRVIEGKIKGG